MSKPSTAPTEAEVIKWMTEKPWIRKELGEYEKPCLDFVERVSQLDGVLTIGVIPYADYVDLWTVTDRNDRELDTAIIEHYGAMVRKSALGLFFDFMIIDETGHFPEEAIVLYKRRSDAKSSPP